MSDIKEAKREKIIYCHFSFKRPKGSGYGLFAVGMYSDYEGKNCIIHKTKKMHLWENRQFVTAVQSYENALACIYEWQGLMVEAGIRQVMLVTDNSTLAGWIENNNKNKDYKVYMERANNHYKIGGAKEIQLAVGLCEPRKSEKSYKYCVEEHVVEDYTARKSDKKKKLALGSEYKSALDFIDTDKSMPEITGLDEVV